MTERHQKEPGLKRTHTRTHTHTHKHTHTHARTHTNLFLNRVARVRKFFFKTCARVDKKKIVIFFRDARVRFSYATRARGANVDGAKNVGQKHTQTHTLTHTHA